MSSPYKQHLDIGGGEDDKGGFGKGNQQDKNTGGHSGSTNQQDGNGNEAGQQLEELTPKERHEREALKDGPWTKFTNQQKRDEEAKKSK